MGEHKKRVSDFVGKASDSSDVQTVGNRLEVLNKESPDTIFNLLFRDYVKEKKQ